MVEKAAKAESYGLAPEFERALAVLAATSAKFWPIIGHQIVVDALRDETAQIIFKAVAAIVKDVGRPPANVTLVIQRLHRQREDGRVSQEQIVDAIDVFDAVHPPDERAAILELAPVLKRRMQADAIRMAMAEFSNSGDFDNVVKKLLAARVVGQHDASLGTRLGPESFDAISKLRHLDRLGTGIPELDIALGGGVPRGTQTIWLGGSGGGKSMAMSFMAAHALKAGIFVLVSTLELAEAEWHARVMAALTGVPITAIMQNEEACRDEVEALLPTLGTIIIKDFPAKATTMPDLKEWVKECEDDESRPCDLLVIDYGDKLKSHNRDDRNEYAGQGTVFEEMRLYAHQSSKWIVTGSQATRRAGKDKKFRRIELDDIADSMNKSRVADQVISLALTPDADQFEYFIAKNRHGRGNIGVGPLPHDLDCGRMVVEV